MEQNRRETFLESIQSRTSSIEIINLSLLSFNQAREYQQNRLQLVRSSTVQECIFICEHPHTLSLGKQTKDSHLGTTKILSPEPDVEIVHADRGGSITYHGPGQIVMYPVINLRKRRLGVKNFVELGLKSAQAVLNELGIDTTISFEKVGIWVESTDGFMRKILSVGLRIEKGISNHGFSLNVCPALERFFDFFPCGEPGNLVSSISFEKPSLKISPQEVGEMWANYFVQSLQAVAKV